MSRGLECRAQWRSEHDLAGRPFSPLPAPLSLIHSGEESRHGREFDVNVIAIGQDVLTPAHAVLTKSTSLDDTRRHGSAEQRAKILIRRHVMDRTTLDVTTAVTGGQEVGSSNLPSPTDESGGVVSSP